MREPLDYPALDLAKARTQAAKSVEQHMLERLGEFRAGKLLEALDLAMEVALAEHKRCAQPYGAAPDMDAAVAAAFYDGLHDLRQRLLFDDAPKAASNLAERDHAEAQEALADLETDLAQEKAA